MEAEKQLKRVESENYELNRCSTIRRFGEAVDSDSDEFLDRADDLDREGEVAI